MKELFLNFLEVSVSGSILICLTLLLRVIFRRAPKAMLCVLWAMILLRLLLPFRIESPLSLRPEPSYTVRNGALMLLEPEPDYFISNPELDTDTESEYETQEKVDPLQIFSAVWLAGVCLMGLYTLASYLHLKMRVAESVRVEKGIYVCHRLDTAFLLGYIHPRIYLPNGMSNESASMVIAHERAHLKRGDHWLKLAGFVCLALHWYNPLVWIAFSLLCKDIEAACDELVIRDMQTEERKAYSAALLSCGNRRKKPIGCPVAFAEGNIKERIMGILNYRKPTIWICAILVIAIVLTAVFLLPDASGPEHPEYYDELIGMLGLPMDQVYQELGITGDDVEGLDDRSGLYKTPLKAEYGGVSFDLWLIALYGENTLGGFQYWNVYEQNKERAVKDTVAVAHKLWHEFGESGYPRSKKDPEQLKNVTEESVHKTFENYRRQHIGISEISDRWDMTNSGEGRIEEYLDELLNSEIWLASYGDTAFVPHYAMTFTAWNDDEVDEATVAITYKTHIGDGNSYS